MTPGGPRPSGHGMALFFHNMKMFLYPQSKMREQGRRMSSSESFTTTACILATIGSTELIAAWRLKEKCFLFGRVLILPSPLNWS